MTLARIAMTSGFTLVPEGEHVFRIYDVKYDEDFGKLTVRMVTAVGIKHDERFSLKDSNDEPNEKALNAFSYFAKTALNDYTLTDIDHTDLIGHYIRAEVIHTVLPNRRDPSKNVTFANLGDKSPADGFDTDPVPEAVHMGAAAPVASQKAPEAPATAPAFNLDELLG